MLAPALIRQLAAELQESERSRVQVEHFSKRSSEMAVEESFRFVRHSV